MNDMSSFLSSHSPACGAWPAFTRNARFQAMSAMALSRHRGLLPAAMERERAPKCRRACAATAHELLPFKQHVSTVGGRQVNSALVHLDLCGELYARWLFFGCAPHPVCTAKTDWSRVMPLDAVVWNLVCAQSLNGVAPPAPTLWVSFTRVLKLCGQESRSAGVR